jgi:hypothetical protein
VDFESIPHRGLATLPIGFACLTIGDAGGFHYTLRHAKLFPCACEVDRRVSPFKVANLQGAIPEPFAIFGEKPRNARLGADATICNLQIQNKSSLI